ncbi:transporter substrate-binding domain-containing protein [Roseomonas sp. OT10]|uniref:substrate-binding periplasmic protein n=1 Tax=Roseomonas cutis TaxID=2897332 RepID=UPI001E63CD5D|nr:transporter substrate-binding domain-containing protein [Roseomonas sp. OT10]UFN48503.1 transporter substrate-binding domain-containing protein [Roseomonas sp. OT10]
MKRLLPALAMLAVLGGTPARAQNAGHDDTRPLIVGLDVGERPFAFTEANGQVAGFSYDLAKLIAERLGRPGMEVVDVNFSAMFAGLFSGRFEMSTAPVTIRPERAERLLFSEPFLSTGMAFITRRNLGLDSLEALSGRTLAVNTGGSHDQWATANAQTYGFTIQRYNKTADALQAVLSGRAQVMLTEEPVARSFVTLSPTIQVARTLETGLAFGLIFRNEDEAFRDRVEVILECIKTSGAMRDLHRKWFGIDPAPGSVAATPMPGFGPPGFTGFRASAEPPGCR